MWKLNSRDMSRSLCRLLLYVNHVLFAYFNIAKMSFNDIRENKILAKIYEFTVFYLLHYCLIDKSNIISIEDKV